ncbi:general secretion pathway protein GspB [Pseudoalteromonas sp. SMS1]|uniref:general secretion pathway protein GspB n=1 Tax=Pseudoalteromonas sp. SMS1 TaxID=2908894 RepID=UPI001F2828B6|nr:general secretion pathway protein GspB [Pseudoalteromonas sp. SMS1]MCF2856620.1 general secretion pathway protein GspB [Pseudoalteromonas sp. SMS1]
MSYLVNALKQSQQQSKSEQDYVQARQSAQVAFYKRLSMGLGGGLLTVCALGAGYLVGQSVQSTPVTEVSPQVATTQEVTEGAKAEPSVDKATSTPEPVTSSTTAQVVPATAAPIQTQVILQPGQVMTQTPVQMQPQFNAGVNNQISYQWMSVHVGFDAAGSPVYSQQLVPVNSQGQIINVPVQGHTPQMQPFVPNQQFTQSNMGYTPQSMVTTNNQNRGQYRAVGSSYSRVEQSNLVEQQQADELEGVSDELKQAFAQAVAESDYREERTDAEVVSSSRGTANATPVELLPPRLQNSIPSLRYQAHIYATEPEKRWIKINNRELYEGDNLGALTIVEITPEQALFDFDGIEFTLSAMQDWIP